MEYILLLMFIGIVGLLLTGHKDELDTIKHSENLNPVTKKYQFLFVVLYILFILGGIFYFLSV